MDIDHNYVVVAVHGEGDRSTVNSLQAHRNNYEIGRMNQFGHPAPAHLYDPPDEAPDVVIIMRDEHHDKRIEHPVRSWEEVEKWKEIIGWDDQKRHWKTGAVVKVRFGV